MMVPLFQETHMLHSDEKNIWRHMLPDIKNYITKGSNTPLFIYHDIFQYFSSTKNAAGKN